MTVCPLPWRATPIPNTKDTTTTGVIEDTGEIDEAVEEVETETVEVVDNKPTADPRTNHIVSWIRVPLDS